MAKKENKLVLKDINTVQEKPKEFFSKSEITSKKNNFINIKSKKESTKNHLLPENIYLNQEELLYERDIYIYLLGKEKKYKLSDRFLRSSINHEMRTIVIDWLTEVQHYLRIGGEELFLGVKILDMIIDIYPLESNHLQLAAIVTLWLAHKYFNRRKQLKVKDMLFLCESIYTSQDFFKMEKTILRILNFDLNYTEPWLFLIYYSHKFNISEEVFYAANYFLDLILLKAKYSTKKDSLKAGGALYTAIELLEPICLKNTKEFVIGGYSIHEYLDINRDIKMLLKIICVGKNKLNGAFNKYKSNLYNKISLKLSQMK